MTTCRARFRFVKCYTRLCHLGRTMEIVEPRSASPYMGGIQSWTTVDMAYMHSEGISIIFPSLMFNRQIMVNPA